MLERGKSVILGVGIVLGCGMYCNIGAEAGYSEEYIRKVVEDKKDYKGEWENRVIIAEDTLDNYLPEEEDSDSFRAKRFVTEYRVDDRESTRFRLNVTGYNRDYLTRNLDNKTLSFKTDLEKYLKFKKRYRLNSKISLKFRRRRYDEVITNDFDQVGGKYALKMEDKGNMDVSGTFGLDRFQYPRDRSKSPFATAI